MTANVAVSLGTPETIGTLLFEDQGNNYGWALSGSTLNMNAGAAVPNIVVSNQSVNISAALASTNGLFIYGAGVGGLAATLSSINNSFTNLTLSGVSVTSHHGGGEREHHL